MGEGQNFNTNRGLEEVSPSSQDVSEGFKTSTEKAIAVVVEIARDLDLEVEPKEVTELQQSCEKSATDAESLFMNE